MNKFIVIAMVIVTVGVVLFASLIIGGYALTGNSVLSKDTKISISRSVSACTIGEDCSVNLRISTGAGIKELQIQEIVPKSWELTGSVPSYSFYDKNAGKIIWDINGTIGINNVLTYTLLPLSKTGKLSGKWTSYPNGKKGTISGIKTITAKTNTSPLIVNITQPINNSNITTKSIEILATTSRKSLCKYSVSITPSGNDAGGFSRLVQMNVTRGISQSQTIENLQDSSDYRVRLSCLDVLSKVGISSAEFWVHNLFPEFAKLSTPTRRLMLGDSINSVKGVITKYDLPNLLSDGRIYSDNISVRNHHYSDKAIIESHLGETNCQDTNWCDGADINHDGDVNLTDEYSFYDYMGRTNCSVKNNWCNYSDINRDGMAIGYDYEEGFLAMYSPALILGSSKIENSTSNNDSFYPQVLIEAKTNPSNYLYKYQLAFSNSVNFSAIPGKVIRMAGEDYSVNESSTAQKIVLSKGDGSYITLEDNKSAARNGISINGTYVKLNPPSGAIAVIEIGFAMQNPKKDYIVVGEAYDDPIFQNIRLDFRSYSRDSGAEVYIGSVKSYG